MPVTTEAGADLIRVFRKDLTVYAPRMLRIQTKDAQVIPFEFNRAQRIVEDKVEAQLASLGYVRALVLKARQEGISTYVAARIYRGCTLWPNRNALVLGDKDERSSILYRIYERYHDNVPAEGLRPGTRTSRRGQELLFTHDSQIAVATAGGKNPGRGMTRWYIHASELAFWDHQLETLVGVLQTVPQGAGEVFIESTANGVGDEFHSRWEMAEAGESDWLAIFLPWWIHEEYSMRITAEDVTIITATADAWEREALETGILWEGEYWKLEPAQLAWRRWKIANDFGGDSRTFRQEFPATAEEAFLVSGNAFFDELALRDYRKASKPPKRGNPLKMGPGYAIAPAERGYLRQFEKPLAGCHYVIGADTAEGRLAAAHDTSLSDPESERGGRDFSCADVIRLAYTDEAGVQQPAAQVAQLHGRMAPEIFAEFIYRLGHIYSCGRSDSPFREPALVGVERNHESGQTVIRWLRDHDYPKQYVHRRMNQRRDKPTEDIGWVTDRNTRLPMLDEMAEAIRNGTLNMPSADTIRECFTFVRGDDGRPAAQEGTHDDRVISLAIGLQMQRHHSHGAVGKLPEPEVEDSPTGW